MPWSSSGLTVSLSNDGDRVAVGAPYNDGAGTNAGHARVYQWTGSTWSQVAGDMDGEVTEDKFGQGIALSGDGKTLIAGAWLNDGPGPLGADTGHAESSDLPRLMHRYQSQLIQQVSKFCLITLTAPKSYFHKLRFKKIDPWARRSA